MERLSETDSDEEGHDHRVISRYLKHFLEYIPESVEGRYQARLEQERNPDQRAAQEGGGTPWMEDDGTTDEDEV